MFPIRDHNPSERTPYVTWALIALNLAVFASYWPLFNDERALVNFYLDWALIPRELQDGHGYGGLISAMFLHGGVMHLAGNMLFLWIFGDNLEDTLGHVWFLGFYLASGVGAGLAQVLVDPASITPVIGASGAIAGVMGGYLLLFPKARVDVIFIFIVFFKVFPMPAWVMLGVWFGVQLLNGAVGMTEGGGVAYWAHAGGFVVGAALILPLWAGRGGPGYWRRTEGHPEHPEARYKLRPSSLPRIMRRKSDD